LAIFDRCSHRSIGGQSPRRAKPNGRPGHSSIENRTWRIPERR
jgi:hypothetical protein